MQMRKRMALALRRNREPHERGIAMKVLDEKVREALKRILPL